MKLNKKTFIVLCLSFLFFSCNKQNDQIEEPKQQGQAHVFFNTRALDPTQEEMLDISKKASLNNINPTKETQIIQVNDKYSLEVETQYQDNNDFKKYASRSVYKVDTGVKYLVLIYNEDGSFHSQHAMVIGAENPRILLEAGKKYTFAAISYNSKDKSPSKLIVIDDPDPEYRLPKNFNNALIPATLDPDYMVAKIENIELIDGDNYLDFEFQHISASLNELEVTSKYLNEDGQIAPITSFGNVYVSPHYVGYTYSLSDFSFPVGGNAVVTTEGLRKEFTYVSDSGNLKIVAGPFFTLIASPDISNSAVGNIRISSIGVGSTEFAMSEIDIPIKFTLGKRIKKVTVSIINPK